VSAGDAPVHGGDRAARYDAWYATPLGAASHRFELAAVAEVARALPGEAALDAGCGTGIYTAWLSERGLRVVGVDRDEAMLTVARARAPQASFARGLVTELPFAAAEFDLVLAVTVLCFLTPDERRAAAGELVRVTRPGGRVVLGELARFSLWAAQRRVKGWWGSETWRAARFTSAGELVSLLREAGGRPAGAARHAVYLPPVDRGLVTRHAGGFERLGQLLGPVGAAFVVVRAEIGA
jgi:ubiquinone/menaquinone biosynthesis C-methylase UbiE